MGEEHSLTRDSGGKRSVLFISRPLTPTMAALTLNRTRSLARRALPYGRSEVRVNLDLASTLLAEAVEDFRRTWSFDPIDGVPLVGLGRVLWVPESSFQPNPAQSPQPTQLPAQTPRTPQEAQAQCVQNNATQEFHSSRAQELQAQSPPKPQESPARRDEKPTPQEFTAQRYHIQPESPAQCTQRQPESSVQYIQTQQESPAQGVQKTATQELLAQGVQKPATQEFSAQRVNKPAPQDPSAVKSAPNQQFLLLLTSHGRDENKENSGRGTGGASVAAAGDSNSNSSSKRKARGGRRRGGDGPRLRQTCITGECVLHCVVLW